MDSCIGSFSGLAILNRTKEFESVEIGVEEGVDLGSRVKDSLLPNLVLQGGALLSFNVV